jgi:hypothetical protein
MFTKPSKIIGWTVAFLFLLVAFQPYYFFMDKRSFLQIQNSVYTYFLYAVLFAIVVWIADLWRDSYEKFERTCLSYYQKGEWINDDYKNVFLHKNANAFFWILGKMFNLSVLCGGLVLFAYSASLASDLYALIKTSYTIINIPIFIIGTMIYMAIWCGVIFGFVIVCVYPFTFLVKKYPNTKLAIAFENYNKAADFLSNQNKLKEAHNKLVEFNREQSEIFKLGLAEYNRFNEKKS